MAVPFSNTKLRVPKGFQNIIEGLAREILRNQPENMFEFGSKYFDQLMKVREETGHDPAVHGARLEDRFYNNDSFKSPSVDPSSPQQQDAALTIQTNFRKHVAEQEVGEMRQEEAAEKIQAGFRGYQDRQKFEEMNQDKKEEEEEVDIDLNDPDVEKAAVKIQAGFKGFKARQEIKDLKDKSDDKPDEAKVDEDAEEEVDIDLSDPEVGAAALKIQAGFRGFQARKEMTSTKDDQKEENKDTEASTEEPKVESQEEEVDIDLTDPEVADAALKIQSGFRGHKARKDLKAKQDDQKEENKDTDATAEEPKVESQEEEVDIDLTDPEVAGAALKIQSGFRGHQARKELKAKQYVPYTDFQQMLKEPSVKGGLWKQPANGLYKMVQIGQHLLQETKEGDEPAPPKTEEEEEVDIDLNDPDVENAALKIQAGFKGMKARQEIKEMKDTKTPEPAKEKTEEKEEEKQEEKQEEEKQEDSNDSDKEKAALKIQAGFKGFQTRKELKAKTESNQEASTEKQPEAEAEKKTEEEVDIDLNDPEVEKAATKIQAGFKGFKTRKELKDKTENSSDDKQEAGEGTTEEPKKEEETKTEEPKTEGEEVDIDLNDPEVAKAATKIQAGFKGYKTRQEITKKKGEDGKE